MVSKGQQSRERIIREAAALFNVRGYAGTAMSDIIDAVNIQKGGIYRHFDSKEAIMLAAFDYAMQQRIEQVEQTVRQGETALDRLGAICDSFTTLIESVELPGGCPILNAAIESDDLYPPLRAKVQAGLDTLRAVIQQVVADGKSSGELHPFANGDVVASLLISACEGGLMMSRLYADSLHLQRAVEHLRAYFESLRA
ncbi:MAG: TetR/AcrR family transcriptional regulator [Anaerolineae bacterium]|jgi:AcrR family transcriptional regulator|nr:TetR/AcrR family transcriptional regulator [Anaerolineae bacterium]